MYKTYKSFNIAFSSQIFTNYSASNNLKAIRMNIKKSRKSVILLNFLLSDGN